MMRAVGIALLALALSAGPAQAVEVGVSAFGGANIPIVQDDTGGGFVYGLRAPVALIPMITVEPYWASSKLGDKDQDIGGTTYTRSGFDQTAFGANVVLFGTSGFYPFVGLGSYEMTRTGSEDIKETGWNFGLGMGLGLSPKLSLHARGQLDMIVTGDTSRKFANLNVGLSYNLFSPR